MLELTHCLKAVSDNRRDGIGDIDPTHAVTWVDGTTDVIGHTKLASRRLAHELHLPSRADRPIWLDRFHFTTQQQLQSGRLLER